MQSDSLNQMKLEYTASSKEIKEKILNSYKGMTDYFTKLEAEILKSPYDSVIETIIAKGQRINKTYKKTVKTDIFSGRFPNSYLYLSLSYAETPDKTKLLVYGVYVRTYSP